VTDFIYACVQLLHNLGAAAVVGGPAAAVWLARDNLIVQRRIAWIVTLGWTVQIVSGASFGITTYLLKGELPELTGVGLAALAVKAVCALAAIILMAVYLCAGARWHTSTQLRLWYFLFMLGLAALMSAAFLRWYA
jgi:hypothetical protein